MNEKQILIIMSNLKWVMESFNHRTTPVVAPLSCCYLLVLKNIESVKICPQNSSQAQNPKTPTPKPQTPTAK